MSRFTERQALLLAMAAALAMGLLAASAQAQPQAADAGSAASIRNMAAASAPRGAQPRDAAVSAAVPRRSRPVLRCWQEGRLVFEGSGQLPGPVANATLELRHAARGDIALQLFDLKSGLCLLDHGSEP
ncbi:MAG: hypothetical protein ACKVQR_15070 [Aquabacterium sp.]